MRSSSLIRVFWLMLGGFLLVGKLSSVYHFLAGLQERSAHLQHLYVQLHNQVTTTTFALLFRHKTSLKPNSDSNCYFALDDQTCSERKCCRSSSPRGEIVVRAARRLGALVQQHLSRLQDDLPPLEVQVDQGQGPVLDDILMAGNLNVAY